MVTSAKKPAPATKSAVKPVVKTPARVRRPAAPKPAAAKPVAAPQPAKTEKVTDKAVDKAADKAPKAKKPKLVRDSFTIPKAEYAVLDELKQRAAKLSQPAKKSELLRAGIKALAAMPDAALLAALQAVPAIKTGRPKASDPAA